jgi:hypothetical protein
MQPLHLETFTAGTDCAVLQIAGEVDVYSAPQLRERVIQLLADGIPHLSEAAESQIMWDRDLGTERAMAMLN